MTLKVIEGHKNYFLYLEINFFLDIFCLKFYIDDNIIKTLFIHNMKFDFKGHIRANKAFLFGTNLVSNISTKASIKAQN